jgi:DNA-binding NarL/FixJ family response regulator
MLSGDPELVIEGSFPNGRALLDAVAKMKRPPDVCLLDINMPELDGYQTLLELKRSYPDTRVLMLSQFDHEFVIIKMLKAGANGYMLKDAEPAELKQAIRSIIEKPFYHSRLVNGHLISLVQKGEDYARLSLSDTELEFLKYCCSDLTYKEIADKMNLAKRTVEGYRESLFHKLSVKSRTALALYALKLGVVPLDDTLPKSS